MSVCFKCNSEKPVDEFYKHPQMASSHLGKCKSCTKSDVRSNRKARSEYYLAFDRKRNGDPRDWRLFCLLPGERAFLAEYQGGKDPITGQALRGRTVLDHRHSDGLIRGILNWRTNRDLHIFELTDRGQYGALSEYLRNPPAVDALSGPRYGVIGRIGNKRRRYGPEGKKEPHHTKGSLQ